MSSKDIASSDESPAGCSNENTDDLAVKKLKQTPEDKRRRNYIAVRKHRQLLKDTLEECPRVDGLHELKKKIEMRRPPTVKNEEAGKNEEENKFKRPRRMFPDGVPQELLPPQLPSVFSSPLLQPAVMNPLFHQTVSPYNFLVSPLVSSFNPLLMASTPFPSPILTRPPPMILTPDMVQNMLTQSSDFFQSPLLQSAVRTAPIQFTPDNIDSLWQMCNEQLK